MDITIDSVTLKGFGSPNPAVGGQAQPIRHYDGETLYCHVSQNADRTSVDILFNQIAPHEYLASGPVASVTVAYFNTDVSPSLQTMTWTSGLPNGSYLGGAVRPYLDFSADLQHVTIGLTNAPPVTALTAGNSPQLTLVLVGTELTLSGPRGYFINIPVDPASDFRSVTTARIKWPKSDGFVGPIGSVDVP
jgi:hypothetical protein